MTFLDPAKAQLLASVRPRRAASGLRATRWSRRTTLQTVAALLLVTAVAALRWPLSGSIVPWDSKNHFYAMFRFLGDALRHGSIPLWNPYHFGGYPAVADPQSLLFTPSMLLFALIAPNASMPTFDLMIEAHLLLGGLGMLGLGRRWRWEPAAAVLAALVFMLGGSAAARLQHTGMIVSYGFFPPALWALEAALERGSLRLAVAAGIAAVLMALGRDQVAYFLCLVLAGAALREVLRTEDPVAALRRCLPVLVVAGATAAALMAVPILLTLQFLHGSNRPGISYGVALEGSLDPANLLTLLAPNVFGSLDRPYAYFGPGTTTVFGDNWTDRCTNYLFAGTLPIVLVLWHGIVGRRLAERGTRALLALGLGAALFALGRFTPVFGLAFDWIPGVALYRRPADATFVLNLVLAFASGHLLHRFIAEGLPRPARPAAVGIALAALVSAGIAILIAAGLALADRTGHLRDALQAFAVPVAAAGAVALALVLGRTPAPRRSIALVLVAATAGQLVWRNAASALNAEPTATYTAYDPTPDQTRGLAILKADIARQQRQGLRPRVEILGIDGSWQNAAMVFGLENIAGYNPLRIADFARATGVGENSDAPHWRSFPDTFRGYNSRLATLLDLDYLVLGRPLNELPRDVPRPRATLLFGGGRFYVYRLDNPIAPRATFATGVVPVDARAVIEHGSLPDFDAGREALIDTRDLPLVPKALVTTEASTQPAKVTITSDAVNAVAVDVDAQGAGILVLHDLVYPGWEVRVDGVRRPILRADLLFRGVALASGHHTVEFSFHPFSLENLEAAAGGLLRKDGG